MSADDEERRFSALLAAVSECANDLHKAAERLQTIADKIEQAVVRASRR